MEFKRQKSKGNETRRWVSTCKNYSVLWHNAYGQDSYISMVICLKDDGTKWWNFVSGTPPEKPVSNLRRAQKACETHQKLFAAFVKLSHEPGRREGKLAVLRAKSPAAFWWLPIWVHNEADPSLIAILCRPKTRVRAGDEDDEDQDDQSEPTPASETSSSSDSSLPEPPISPIPTGGPVSSVTPVVATTKKKTATATRATSSPLGTPVEPAAAPAKAPRKPSKKSTEPSPPSTEPTSPPGKKPKATAKPVSRSSPKKRK